MAHSLVPMAATSKAMEMALRSVLLFILGFPLVGLLACRSGRFPAFGKVVGQYLSNERLAPAAGALLAEMPDRHATPTPSFSSYPRTTPASLAWFCAGDTLSYISCSVRDATTPLFP
jgi:hypothetical protein